MTRRYRYPDGRVAKTARVRDWCIANPGETLSPSDLRTKFDVTGDQMKMIVSRLRAEGLLEVEFVYLAKRPAAANDPGKEAA
jgi:hypothetical protein